MISVVIPVYNRAELMLRTLDSVAAQTVLPDKLILVDNNSTDGTLEALQKWAAGRDWVEVLQETKPGAAAARNAGLARVRSPYVMFFDSDDYMPPRHVEEVQRGLGGKQLGIFDVRYQDLNGNMVLKPVRGGDLMRQHIFHAIVTTQRCVVATKLAAWNEGLSGWDDIEFGIKILLQNPSVTRINLSEPPTIYAQEVSLTGTDFSSKAGEWERALDACEEALRGTPYTRLIDYRRAILAGMYRREGRPDLARGLSRGLRLKLIERYVALGFRGVAQISRILR